LPKLKNIKANISFIATIQPTTQNKTKQLGWCGIIIGKKTTPPPHHHTTTPGPITFRQPRKLIFDMQPYSNPTRRNMEDDLNDFENGRRPQCF
jgi:hypothetical protein